MTILKGYQPAHVVRYFEEICAIPHPSHHEQALCAYIRGCAERYGHRYVEDAAGNLMVYLNATPGYEDKAPMLLQAHMDMVSAKEPGSNHNFLTDPIRLHIEDGHYLYADDTTLGADNAVGLVNMLALMEDDTVVHPPMELLFTVCEEDGMEGIRQLDMSTIRSRRMLNMDCGDPDVMCVSCAGFVHYVMRLPVTAAGAAGQAYTLQIDGLAGGHSGLMIGTGRASAVVLMGRVLCELLRKVPCRIVSVDCERTMGIAPHMQAEIVLKPEQEPDARKVLEDLLAALREEYANTDPELSLTLEPLGHEADQAMDEASGRRCAELMYLLTDSNLNHTGIYLYSKGKIMIHLTFDYKTDEKCTTPGQYLKYHRTFQGLSTRELAEKVGIVPATLVLYENDRHPIKYSTAVALANVLGIDRNRLLDEYTAFVDYPYFSLLKKVRQDLSLTQIQMAELIGIGQTSYSGWEREIRVPRRKEYDKILAALKKLRVNVDTYLCQSASI